MVRVIGIFLSVEGEDNVIGVQRAGRFKIFIILPLHVFTQMEGIGFPVFANFPFFSQARDDFRGAGFEFHQAVINRH